MRRRLPLIIAIAAVVILCVFGRPSTPEPAPAPPAASARMVTIDGSDPATGTDVGAVNIWDDYRTRAKVVARLKTGDRVEMVGRDGAGVHLRLPDGQVGWVGQGFIRELR